MKRNRNPREPNRLYEECRAHDSRRRTIWRWWCFLYYFDVVVVSFCAFFLFLFFFRLFFFRFFDSLRFEQHEITPQWILLMNGLLRHNNFWPTNKFYWAAKMDCSSKILNFLFHRFSMCGVWALKRILSILCVCNNSVLFCRMFALQIEENVWRPRALFLFYVIAASNACTEVSLSLTVRARTHNRRINTSMRQCVNTRARNARGSALLTHTRQKSNRNEPS